MLALRRVIRQTALHEAAHAVLHWEFGHEVEFATIVPTETLNGFVRIRRVRGEERTDAMVRGTLAGPICDLIANEEIDELGLEEVEGDFTQALMQLSAAHRARFAELWDETVCYVTHPRVWRAIVSVADTLLRRGTLTGSAIGELGREPINVGQIPLRRCVTTSRQLLGIEQTQDSLVSQASF